MPISEFTGWPTIGRLIVFCTKVKLVLWFQAKEAHVLIYAKQDIDWDIAGIARQTLKGFQA
jgi:hypothetical protein